MKFTYHILLFLLIISCDTKEEIDLQKMNGYWEITAVTLKNGEKKEYRVNKVIDFFEIKEINGKRSKVSPKFDGSYTYNGLTENFRIVKSSDSIVFNYITPYDSWTERIMQIQDSILEIKTRDGKLYRYKRHIPFSLK